MQMNCKNITLTDYVDSLQIRGQYTFVRTEAMTTLSLSSNAFKLAALRLIKKNRLIRPKEGFYVIVPTEYLKVGAPPVTWFIDSLMTFHQQPYYIGLLSAAALYGAAHQQPQVFQVMTNQSLRMIFAGQSRIQFFSKKIMIPSHCQAMKTPTGYVQVSFPELTAFDLVRYNKAAGYLSHIATVLSELQESFDEERFADVLKAENLSIPVVQRLGYLLELIATKQIFILLLKQWLKEHSPRLIPLYADKEYDKTQQNKVWHLYINEKIEPDL
jgi:predicted transcriptional regulator of viral defense system